MKYLIVGISGASCSGKTSVTTRLQKKFKDSHIIRQDDYFLLQDDPRHTLIPELNHFNWEILSSLDMPKMHSDLLKLINSNECRRDNDKKLLLVEDISRELCWSRRRVRCYDPPDVPGYFDKVVWPEYLRHKSQIMNDTDLYKTIRVLDGNKSLEELCDEITNDICKVL